MNLRLPEGKRRRLLNVSLSLTVGLAAACCAWPLFPKPTVTVQTYVSVPRTVWRMGDIPDPAAHQKAQLALVKSRRVLAATLKDNVVATLPAVTGQPDPLGWLEKQVQADFFPGTEDLRIAMTGENPEDLALTVLALRTAYVREIERQFNDLRDRWLAEMRPQTPKQEAINDLLRRAPSGVDVPGGVKVAHRTSGAPRAIVSILTGLAFALIVLVLRSRLGRSSHAPHGRLGPLRRPVQSHGPA
jgi:hypothetical protein